MCKQATFGLRIWICGQAVRYFHVNFVFILLLVHLRESLMALPVEVLERTDVAVVVPAFELKGKDSCTSMKSCADRQVLFVWNDNIEHPV